MNRPSYRRRNILSGGRGLALALCALVLAAALAVRFVFPSAFSALSAPLWRVGAFASQKARAIGTTTSRSALLESQQELGEQNAALSAQNAALAAQVADLTALLGGRTAPPKGIVASVLARPPVAPYDVLIVDQGASAGVRQGAQAYGAGGTPIGVVGEVEGSRSRVTLYSARTMKTDGWAGADRIPLTIDGIGAGAFRATVSKDAGVAVGDGVYVAHDGAFPVGTVTNIEQDPSSPTVELDVRPYANPFSLTWVTISSQ